MSKHRMKVDFAKDWPVQIPAAIFSVQAKLGAEAVLLWINLLRVTDDVVDLDELAKDMGFSQQQMQKALKILEAEHWIGRKEGELQIYLEPCVSSDAGVAEGRVLDPKQANIEWLVEFWTNLVATPTSKELNAICHWVEEKGLSHEVVALAMEEMLEAVSKPSFSYLEGVLKNWYATGIREYKDILERPGIAKVLLQSPGQQIHPEAVKKWKEFFPNEFE